MPRYGRSDCNHIWRYRIDGWEDQCAPAICISCGAFSCGCKYFDNINYYNKEEFEKAKNIFFNEGVRYDANINGKWENPYIKKTNNKKYSFKKYSFCVSCEFINSNNCINCIIDGYECPSGYYPKVINNIIK